MTNQDNHSSEHIFRPEVGGTGVVCSCGNKYSTTSDAQQHRQWELDKLTRGNDLVKHDPEHKGTLVKSATPAQPEQHTTELQKIIETLTEEATTHMFNMSLAPELTKDLIMNAEKRATEQINALINHKVVSELEKSLDEHARTCGARRVGDPRDWCRFQEVVEAQIEFRL